MTTEALSGLGWQVIDRRPHAAPISAISSHRPAGRAARPATNKRTHGSRRASSRSAGGGDSGEDGESDAGLAPRRPCPDCDGFIEKKSRTGPWPDRCDDCKRKADAARKQADRRLEALQNWVEELAQEMFAIKARVREQEDGADTESDECGNCDHGGGERGRNPVVGSLGQDCWKCGRWVGFELTALARRHGARLTSRAATKLLEEFGNYPRARSAIIAMAQAEIQRRRREALRHVVATASLPEPWAFASAEDQAEIVPFPSRPESLAAAA